MIRTIFCAALLTASLPTVAFADPPGRNKVKDCPPGLRDKGCIPPGQAKKYQLGAPIPDDYGFLRDYQRYELPVPPPGKAYTEIDGEIILVDTETKIALDVVKVLGDVVF